MIEIRLRTMGEVAVVDVAGRMVLSGNAHDRLLADTVVNLVSDGHRRILVNLGGVTQVDTSGLSALVTAHHAAVRHGASLAVVNPTKRIRELLSITRLDLLFETCDADTTAIGRLDHRYGCSA